MFDNMWAGMCGAGRCRVEVGRQGADPPGDLQAGGSLWLLF